MPWWACTTTLLVVPACQVTYCRLAESVPGLLKRLQIGAQATLDSGIGSLESIPRLHNMKSEDEDDFFWIKTNIFVPQLSKGQRITNLLVPKLLKERRQTKVFVPQLSKEQRRSEVFVP
jgi:hypothetical protein